MALTKFTRVSQPMVEPIVFNSVADMKAAKLRVGYRYRCNRYYANGRLEEGLEYVGVTPGSITPDGYIDHTASNGVIARFNGVKLTVWAAGAYPFINSLTAAATDSTANVQAALYYAKDNLIATHSVSKLRTVYGGSGHFLTRGSVYFPEGVGFDGEGKYQCNWCMGWTTTSKIIPYRAMLDAATGEVGKNFTKNFGLSNVSLVPYYGSEEASPSSAVFIDAIFAIELHLSDVRIIQHKGAVGGGRLNSTAIRLQKAIDLDVDGLTVDGGRRGIVSDIVSLQFESVGDPKFGARTSRIRNVFLFNCADNGILMNYVSEDNSISGCSIQFPTNPDAGNYRGIHFQDGNRNTATGVTISGPAGKYGVILESNNNTFDGSVSGSTTLGIDNRGTGNRVSGSNTAGFQDTGTALVLNAGGFNLTGTSMRGGKAIQSNAKDAYVSVAQFPVVALSGYAVTVDVVGTVTGVGRDMYHNNFLVSTDASTAVSVSPGTAFAPNAALGVRIVKDGTNAVIQVAATHASSTGMSCTCTFSITGARSASLV